jgi:hypothetical protein
VGDAYSEVGEHPRRDELLRVRPAWTAFREGAHLLALELIEPVLDRAAIPEVADGAAELLSKWEGGLLVTELPFASEDGTSRGLVVFHHATRVTLGREGAGWVADLDGGRMGARAAGPGEALRELALILATSTRRLVSTPSSNLNPIEVRRKGRLLSVVDILNSDFGLQHAGERWVLGRFEGNQLLPMMRDLPKIDVPEALLPETTAGLYLACVPVLRDGSPSGPATRIEPAGSGLGSRELRALITRMSEGPA